MCACVRVVPDIPSTYNICTCVCVQVMSGSGDLHVMRVIRKLHILVANLTYGGHMAVHMALGLLFLGGGR